MKIGIIGSSGFIGKNLTNYFREKKTLQYSLFHLIKRIKNWLKKFLRR